MRRRRMIFGLALAIPAAALACNALTGVGDLGTGDRCEGCAADDALVAETSRSETGTDAAATLEASTDAPTDTFTRPSYCTGIVLYARFDGTLTTAQGLAADAPPTTMFDAGKYGGAALIYGANAIFYVQGGDGGFTYPKSLEGTMATWVKARWNWPSNDDRIVWKTMPNRTVAAATSGPDMRADVSSAIFGSTCTFPDGGLLNVGAPVAALTPYWKNTEFNHLAETWSQTSPTITFTLNGAIENPAATRRETDAGWLPEFPDVAYLRLSSNAFPLDAAYDDFALWNRALSLAEIQALYTANKALGDACGL